MHHSTLLSLLTTVTLVVASSEFHQKKQLEKRACVGTITKLADVAAAVKCTTINLGPMTVEKGKTLELKLASGTTVYQRGDVTFATGVDWEGNMAKSEPRASISGATSR